MKKLAGVVLITLAPLAAVNAREPKAPEPNIILILADDMGYSDLGCTGSEINTPHLDSLAKNGILYRQFYNATRCMTTRSSLLTGRYVTSESWPANYNHGPTLGEVLQAQGYRTLWSGKNHSAVRPPERGFHRYYGFQGGQSSYWNPGSKLKDGGVFPYVKTFEWMVNDKWVKDYIPEDPNYYMTDAITDQALSWLEEYQDENKPFFLYLPYNSPHWPLHAKDSDIEKYRGVYDKGYQAVRNARYKRMVEKSFIDAETAPLYPAHFPKWDSLSEERRKSESKRMAIYAAMVDNLDQNIGRIIERLTEYDEIDNTLIVFLSDNGASPVKAKSAFKQYPRKGDEKMGGIMSFELYGPNWAVVSNSPLAKCKESSFEGGVRTPMIAHWPKGFTRTGEFDDTPGHIVDLMSTFLELSGGTYPQSFRSRPSKAVDGVSLVPTFSGKSIAERPVPIGNKYGSGQNIRKGKWKLVRKGKKGWELHDMTVSQTETENLAGSRPEMVAELEEEYDKWEARCQAAPASR